MRRVDRDMLDHARRDRGGMGGRVPHCRSSLIHKERERVCESVFVCKRERQRECVRERERSGHARSRSETPSRNGMPRVRLQVLINSFCFEVLNSFQVVPSSSFQVVPSSNINIKLFTLNVFPGAGRGYVAPGRVRRARQLPAPQRYF